MITLTTPPYHFGRVSKYFQITSEANKGKYMEYLYIAKLSNKEVFRMKDDNVKLHIFYLFRT